MAERFKACLRTTWGKTVEMLDGQQQAYQQQLNDMLNTAGMSTVSEMTQQNLKLWTDMQQQMLKMYGIQSTKDE